MSGLAKSVGAFVVGCGLAAGLARGQRYTPPPPPLVVDPCAAHPAALAEAADPKAKVPVCPPPVAPVIKPTGGKPTAAGVFPFPGEAPAKKSAAAADQFPFPGGSAPAAQAGGAAAKGTSAADQFPFPGEAKAPDATPDSPVPADSSGSSSSSSGDDASPAADDDGNAAPAKRGRRPLPKVSAVSPDERVAEDLDVARFYTDRGNFQAAYLRSKDATKVMPDDAEGHFALAQAAEKLHKKDEAVTEYGMYLKLDPAGEKKAVAERALAGLR